MKRYIIGLLAILAILILMGTMWIPGNDAIADPGSNPNYHITWSPSKISTAISPGNSWGMDLIFTSDQDLADASLFVTPELQPLVTVAPKSLSSITANMPNTVHIDIAIPTDAIPGDTYEGTIHVKVGQRTYPQTLKLLIHIAAPLETVTEEAYNETLSVDIEASEMFHELQPSLGPDAAKGAVVEWLLGQDEVLDAGISDDGSIWIVYEMGLDAIIPTSPPGALGSGVLAPSYELARDPLSLASTCVNPGASSAILLWPLCSDPDYQPTSGPTLAEHMARIEDKLARIGYETTCVADEAVTVDLLKSLYLYGVVDFFTHGNTFLSSEVLLMTGEEASFSSFIAHLDDVTSHRLARRGLVEGTWSIRPSFIEYYASAPYPNSLVHANACHSLENNTMADAFLDSGAYVYCGWSDETYTMLNTALYTDLTEDKTLGETYIEWVAKGWNTDGSATWSYYPSHHGDLCLDEVVHFPDPNLEAAIRAAIGKPTGDIYQCDLDGLTSLGAILRGITDLSGLDHCTSLTWLALEFNQISDISPLSTLTNLTFIDLGFNQISVISPISSLTNLTELMLEGNQISDISPLSTLTNLTYLYLGFNQISDISPLSTLTSLTWLSLWANQISTVEPLSGLINLGTLALDQNEISNIEPLSGMTKMKYLYLSSNQISNIEPLSGMIKLEWLKLYNNQISDIKPLVDNPGISSGDYLELTDNPLSPTSIGTYIPQLQARGVTVYY